MRVLVCGGREYDNWNVFSNTLDFELAFGDKNVIIQGGAKGADFLARVWAKDRNVLFEEYPANWKKYGKGAGGVRNQQMLEEGKPDLVIAFPGGSGTADMVRRAKKAGVEVIEIA